MTLDNQQTAKNWFEQYLDKPQEGRAELIALATQCSLSNSDLERILKSDARGPLQGLATSILHERERQGEYSGWYLFDAQYAGAFITARSDYTLWRATVKGDNALYGADIQGDLILKGALIQGDHALAKATVKGNQALLEATLEGDHALQGAIVEGEYALVDATLNGKMVTPSSYLKK